MQLDNRTFGQKESDNSATAEIKNVMMNNGRLDKKNWTFQPNAEIKKARMGENPMKDILHTRFVCAVDEN